MNPPSAAPGPGLAAGANGVFNVGMDRSKIEITGFSEGRESLVVTLQAVARAGGGEVDYDELSGAMGISFAAVAVPSMDTPGCWLCYGRDLYVEASARLFGISLRDMHPTEVGVDMLEAGQYPQHFDFSYKPLIRAALANQQAVVAWQGWADDDRHAWGVVVKEEDGVFLGATPRSGTVRRKLVASSYQCYVVESCIPATPGRKQLLEASIRHANGFLNESPFVGQEILTGPPALRAWRNWLENAGGALNAASAEGLRRHIVRLARNKESATRFLASCEQDVGPSRDLTGAREACELSGRLLAPFAVPADEAAGKDLSKRLGELDDTLKEVESAEEQLAAAIEALARL
jgi:hypothetical protein